MKNIYVGNIARSVTEDKLRDLFAQYGEVASVKVIKDKFTGESKGFAFVEMPGEEEGNAAIEGTNGVDLDGRRLRVSEARPREDRPRKPFNSRPGSGSGFRSPRF